jgi:uncharacterized protein (TIGR02231 family)
MADVATVEFHPPIDATRAVIEAPIAEVTLFEDRARVRRRATLSLAPGRARLVIPAVAPVLQDVSLRAEVVSGSARVGDVRARRALRVRRAEKPAVIQALDEELRDLGSRILRAQHARDRARERFELVATMLHQGAAEVPQDVAWGLADPSRWQETFGALFERARELRQQVWGEYFHQLDLADDARDALRRRALAGRRDDDMVAWVALDLEVDGAEGEEGAAPIAVEVDVEYVVPCALWRPLHSARLADDGTLTFTCQAAVWQNTGEDWSGVTLVCSTARSSLGVEPPLLSDDLLSAQKKSKETVVAAREVAVQSAGPGGPPGPAAVKLPGVDDGGDIQSLRAEGLCTVPADGRPCFLPLFRFESPAEVSRVLMAELEPAVFLKSVQPNAAGRPILAGPVELVRGRGQVGWTQTLFVAPGQRFELGWGPQDDLRVSRMETRARTRQDTVSQWSYCDTDLRLFVSNLGDEARTVEITERLPVSEVEEVTIEVRRLAPKGHPPDEHGFVKWSLTLGPHQREELRLNWRLSTAPGVKGVL